LPVSGDCGYSDFEELGLNSLQLYKSQSVSEPCQFGLNMIGRARRSDAFEDPNKFSRSSLCSQALASELMTEGQQNVMGIQALEFR
jgi:hypothetical protein